MIELNERRAWRRHFELLTPSYYYCCFVCERRQDGLAKATSMPQGAPANSNPLEMIRKENHL